MAEATNVNARLVAISIIPHADVKGFDVTFACAHATLSSQQELARPTLARNEHETEMMTRRDLGKLGLAAAAAAGSWRLLNPAGATEAPMAYEITKSEEEWRKILSPEAFKVLRKHGTEYAGSSPLDKNYAPGTYRCAGCDLPVFSSETKFDSGTGWPSFWKPLDNAIGTSVDRKFFTTRTEVHCRRCGGHLGHVFEDGPPPTGLRYCMNGVAMKFVPKEAS
jgi:peptide-methionine (R)-S-oxide reductase